MEQQDATQDLRSKIIAPTLQDLMSSDDEPGPGCTIDLTFHCDIHGELIVKAIKCWGEGYIGYSCRVCEEEAEKKRQADLVEQNARRDAEEMATVVKRLQFLSGVPERFREKTFEEFKPAGERMASISGICRNYADNFIEKAKTGTGLILCGHAGTGKTHLACAIIDRVIRLHRKRANFIKVSRAIRSVKETYNRDSRTTEQAAINALVSPDLLVLDEVGVQFGSDTEKNILFEIINERYEAVKPTVLISNLALAGLTEFVGDRVVDRMKENGGGLLIFDWQSMRGRTAA